MATTASDVLSEQAVRAVLDDLRTETYQYRRAFRNHDATDISDDRFSFPNRTVELDQDDVQVVEERSNYPRSGLEYGETTVVYDKRGFELSISDEAVSDSRVDLELEAESQEMFSWQASQDYHAFQILNNNLNAAGPIGDAAGDITYSEINDARTTLFGDQYNLSQLIGITGPDGMNDLTTLAEFTQPSEMGDFVLQTGLLPNGNIGPMFLGEAGGIPWFATNTGDLGAGEAFVVDTSAYGYESTRWDVEIIQYREEETDEDVWKIRGRNAFVATDPSAAIKITG